MSLTRALEEGSQSYETLVTLSLEGREELMWWDNHMSKWNGKSLVKTEIDKVIDSDASLTRWGAICSQQRTRGPWSAEESKMHINCLELLAATFAVKTFVKKLIGHVLSQAQTQNAHLVLLAPVWKSQPWYPVLLGMLVDYPRLLPRDSQVMISPDPSILTLQLAVWRTSRIDTKAISFRRKLGAHAQLLENKD